ncbi:ABC transporter permease, partial [Burkholderia sp. Ap-962]|nr:ABC transporter permease [Burkholderia sp. Ap-962]
MVSSSATPSATPAARRRPDLRGLVLPALALLAWWAVAAARHDHAGLLVGPDAVLRTA